MNRVFSSVAVAVAVVVCAASTAVAVTHDFNQTGAGTFDSNVGGNWNGGVPSANGQDVNFTQSISSGNQVVTNFFSSGGGALNYVRLATTGSSLLTVISTAGIDSFFGLQLNARDTLILANTSTLSHSNNSFDNSGGGTLVLSNGALVVVNLGGGQMNNQGTISLTSGADLNFGQCGTLNNNSGGTIIKNDTGGGTAHLTGTFGGSNISIQNNGTIIVNNGTLIANPVGAFNDHGFNNASGGRIFIDGATFAIDRSSGAWTGDANPQNDGRIFLNGGSITVLFAGSQASDRGIVNNGTISGSGTLALRIAQTNTGQTIASNGVLNVFQTVAGNQQTFTSSGGNFGTMKALSGGTLKVNGTVLTGNAASWVVNNGGTLDVGGNNVDLGAAFMPGSQLNGTIRVTTGGNFTLSGATGISGQTLSQNGIFDLEGGRILMPDLAGLQPFTNAAAATITGWGTLQTGQTGNSYDMQNFGTILATNNTLVVDTVNSFGGFKNEAGATVAISNSATFGINRGSAAWDGSGLAFNGGTIQMGGGTLTSYRSTGQDVLGSHNGNYWLQSGTIIGSGTIAASFQQSTTGQILASNGVLNIFGNYASGQATFTSSGGSFGTFKAVNGGTLKFDGNVASGLGGAWVVNSGGTLDVGGNSVDLGAAFMPGSALNGTVTITSGGNFTLASAAAAAPTLSQQGLVSISGGSLFMPNVASLGRFTNSGTILVNGGGLFQTGYGVGQNNYSVQNNGTIIVTNGLFTIRPDDVFNGGGLLNNGTISVQNNGTLTITRSNNAWVNAGTSPTNTGGILLSSGVVRGSNTTVATLAGTLVNANTGSISGSGTIQGFTTLDNSGTIQASGGTIAVDPLGTGYLVNRAGGLVTASSANLNIVAVLTNAGTLNMLTSAGTFGSALANSGAIEVDTSTLTGSAGSQLLNQLGGFVRGNGTIAGFGAVLNSGTILANNGTIALVLGTTVTNQASGHIDAVNGRIAVSGALANSGTVNLLGSLGTFNSSVANSGTILVDTSTVTGLAGNQLVNQAAGLISGDGTIAGFGAVLNSGTILANNGTIALVLGTAVNNQIGGTIKANGARLLVGGVFTNAGTFTMLNGVATFAQPVVNAGAWITDPSTNIFLDSVTIVSTGYVNAAAGDLYEFQKNLVNQSASNTAWNTLNVTPGSALGSPSTKFVFDNLSSNGTQEFFHAGLRLTGGFSGTPIPGSNGVQFVTSFAGVQGFQNNFALGRLEIGNVGTNSTVELYDAFPADGTNAAVFVNDLVMFGSSMLIVSNNVDVYFVNSNGWSMANVTLLGNGEIHQLELQPGLVPEPSVALLWAAGLGTLWGAARRRRRAVK